MRRRRRTEILIESPSGPALAARMARTLRSRHDIREVTGTSECLVMVRARETARNSVFNLGEVLVSEAKAMLADKVGIGLVRGSRLDLAADLAAIDAVAMAAAGDLAEFEGALLDAEAELLATRAQAARRVEKTKVDFRTMDAMP